MIYSSFDKLKNGVSNILVAIRVRLLSQKERSLSGFETIQILDNKMIVLLDPEPEREDDILRKNRLKETNLAFDFLFDQRASQQMIYQNTTQFMSEGVLEGYNTKVFCYGPTCSGKTFTQFVQLLNKRLQQLFNYSIQEGFKDTLFKVCYVDIYNENIRDLRKQKSRNK